ncbi:MAG: hypothetical protein M0P70_08890 [Desulfobulbaceae bacterium]|nr:hypothetical protein [Desulfobulbaceae bacterium]
MMSSGRKFAMILTMTGLVLMGTYPLHARQVGHYKFLVESEDPQRCIDCHYGQEDDSKNSPCPKNCLVDPASSHPVAKKYPPRGKEKEYIPLKELRKTGLVKLQDGKITCVSCHDVANNIAYHTVVEDRGTHLCKLCHIR